MFRPILGQDGSNELCLLGFTSNFHWFYYAFCLIFERCWDQCSFDYNAIARCMLQHNSMRDHLSYTAQTNSRASGTSAYSHLLKASSEKKKVRATSIFTSGDASSWGPLRIADLPSKATDYDYISLHHSDHHNIRTSNSGGVDSRGGSLWIMIENDQLVENHVKEKCVFV